MEGGGVQIIGIHHGRGRWDWSLITGRSGLQNGKIAGPKLFAPPLKTG